MKVTGSLSRDHQNVMAWPAPCQSSKSQPTHSQHTNRVRTDFGGKNSRAFQGLFQDELHFFKNFLSALLVHTHRNEVTVGWSSRFTSWFNIWYRGYQLNTISNNQQTNYLKNTKKHWKQNQVRVEKLGARESLPDWDSYNYFW
jgi:hypothetical protein